MTLSVVPGSAWEVLRVNLGLIALNRSSSNLCRKIPLHISELQLNSLQFRKIGLLKLTKFSENNVIFRDV